MVRGPEDANRREEEQARRKKEEEALRLTTSWPGVGRCGRLVPRRASEEPRGG